ncbi:MAG: hypothetical protein Q8Q42_00405 [Nanoarchaeota archaeon]|nr:hypothetical protein [Nanoarchaeota archaeon]
MDDKNSLFQENIRNSFSKVKLDIDLFSENLNILKKDIDNLKNENSDLKLKINEIFEILKEIKANMGNNHNSENPIFFGSTGNNGVTQQHATTRNNTQQHTTTNNNKQQHTTTHNNTQQANPRELYLENIFKSLTDREFSTFLAAYEISREYGEVTFQQLAERLKLTEAYLRGLVRTIINKKVPLEKERVMHGRVSIFIRKDFDVSTLEKIMRRRLGDSSEQMKLGN